MRKLINFSLLALAIFNISCTDKTGLNWEQPDDYIYATVCKIDQSEANENQEDSSSTYFILDNQETFNVTESKNYFDYNILQAGQRIIAGVTLESNYEEGYDYSAKLYDVIHVTIGENRVIETTEQNNELADNTLSYISTNSSLTMGYLNLFVGFQTLAIENTKLYLVENLAPTTTDNLSSNNYLNLELRYDGRGFENVGELYERYISFDMESFKEKLEGKDGVALRVKTQKSGVTVIEIKSKDLFPSQEN